MSADDLRTWTMSWASQYWDHEAHMVWNPPASIAPSIEARTVHLTPNTAWLAYGLLGSDDAADRAEAVRAVAALIGLQYDAPGTEFHGTFARFMETPYPPERPAMWVDYDPNWRQFVGTTFALMLEDYEERLGAELAARVERSIGLACSGEPDGRIDVNYANPALMRAWLDGWYGQRIGDDEQRSRGESFGRAVVAAHDEHGAFDEFNSPTYYGIDIYALRLWQLFPPTGWFAEHGERVERELWSTAARFFNPELRNFCGPYTRSYHPDATRSVALFSLWLWAELGRERAPLPALDAPRIDHSHDLMAGPVFARLAAAPAEIDLAAFTEPTPARDVRVRLANDRTVTAHVERSLMLGAESSPHDWGGWSQFMPVTAHWAEGDGVAVLWLLAPRRTRATVRDRSIALECQLPLEFRLLAPACVALADGFDTDAVHVRIGPDALVTVAAVDPGDFRVFVAALTEDETRDPVGHERGLVLTFDLHGDRAGDVDRVALQLDRLGDA